MPLSQFTRLTRFLETLMDSDVASDLESAKAYVRARGSASEMADDISALLKQTPLPLGDIGTASNRWFESDDDARAWLAGFLTVLASAGGESQVVVKDSNGASLAEGDTVSVIKDLKVKGAATDLKRGTMIKKIHLVDDPEVVECRVLGSTLVLKTCFLKKVVE